MTKPDDVSQEAWDMAASVVGVPDRLGYAKVFTADIARAILAAKAEEREVCARIGDEHAQLLRQNYDRSCAIALEGLATAIRKRGGA